MAVQGGYSPIWQGLGGSNRRTQGHRVYSRNAPNYFNIKNAPYGAAGDGQTNDTNAVQQAYDDAYRDGGWVYVPRGTFLVDTVEIKATTIGPGTLKATPKTLQSERREFLIVPFGYNGVMIRDITIDGSRTGAGPGDGTYLGVHGLQVYAENVRITNVHMFSIFRWGIEAQWADGLQIDHCEIHDCAGLAGDPINVGMSHGVEVSHNHLYDFERIGIVFQGNAKQPLNGTIDRRSVIAHNRIYNGHDASASESNAGIWMEAASSALIQGNYIWNMDNDAGNEGRGITINSTGFEQPPAQPTGSTSGTGGAIPAGTYYAMVTTVNDLGETTASLESAPIVTVGATSTITVTGPAVDGSQRNYTQVNVYVTPVTATPGSEVLAGSYTSGDFLTLTSLPNPGNPPPPTENTSNIGETYDIDGNHIRDVKHGILLGGEDRARVNIRGGSITEAETTSIWVNFGGHVSIRDVFFGRRLNTEAAAGHIYTDPQTANRSLKLSVHGCTLEDGGTYENNAADICIDNTAGEIDLVTLRNLEGKDPWRILFLEGANEFRASECKLKNGRDTGGNDYSMFNAPLIRIDNCELIDNAGVAARVFPEDQAIEATFSNCHFDSFGNWQWPAGDHEHRIEVSGGKLEGTMMRFRSGVLRIHDSWVVNPPTDGLVYTSDINAAQREVFINGCKVEDAVGNPLVKLWTHAPTRCVLVNNDVPETTPLTSGFNPTYVDGNVGGVHFCTPGGSTAEVALRLGKTPTEGYEHPVISETVDCSVAAASHDLSQDVPVGSIIKGILTNNETAITGAGGAVRIGIGVAADPDKYGITTLAKNDKISEIFVGTKLAVAEDVQLFACDAAGNALGTIGGAGELARVYLVYQAPNPLDDAP